MTSAHRLKILSSSGKTVFTLGNLQALWNMSPATVRITAKRMVDDRLLTRIARGYLSLEEKFNILELANLIITPSYISLHSALFHHGVSFQVSRAVTSISLLNYRRNAGGTAFQYFAMKDSLFFNLDGIRYKNNLAVAEPERALLDCLYFHLLPSLDNGDMINPLILRKLSVRYPKTVQAEIPRYLEKGMTKT